VRLREVVVGVEGAMGALSEKGGLGEMRNCCMKKFELEVKLHISSRRWNHQ
jgi:hypothetical protein